MIWLFLSVPDTEKIFTAIFPEWDGPTQTCCLLKNVCMGLSLVNNTCPITKQLETGVTLASQSKRGIQPINVQERWLPFRACPSNRAYPRINHYHYPWNHFSSKPLFDLKKWVLRVKISPIYELFISTSMGCWGPTPPRCAERGKKLLLCREIWFCFYFTGMTTMKTLRILFSKVTNVPTSPITAWEYPYSEPWRYLRGKRKKVCSPVYCSPYGDWGNRPLGNGCSETSWN